MNRLGIRERPDEIAELQALSAIGQVHLMALYDRIFGAFHQQVAQVLLTRDVVDYPHSRQNVWQTLEALLTNGVLPIVNENDAVSVDEFDHQTTFGENDQLAAVVSHLVDADLLIIMSDIDGLYDANPKHHPDAHLIPWVAQVDDHLLGSAEGPGSQFGSGGMATKLRAADLVLKHGGQMALVNGNDPQNVVRALNNQPVGTRFSAQRPKYL
ncbi:glutamate 5-kinase [Lactobacillaceae bacterium L1_55_11]|nr:glutamate 5-kinase [Lactobacillaceae bacterium L1_55_11]